MEVIYYVAASADGYIATPDGGVEWLHAHPQGDEDYGYEPFIATIDVIFMGRATYEVCRDQNAFRHFRLPTWVFTRSGLQPTEERVRATARSPEDLVGELSGTYHRGWLMGGGVLASSFQRANLITEYRIFVVPTLLGAGIPLFGEGGGRGAVRLASVESWESGMVELRYTS